MKSCRVHLLLTMLLAAFAVQAQVSLAPPPDVNGVDDRTFDSLAVAQTARPVPGSSRKGNNPVLFLVGNSTMRNGTRGDGRNGQWGWGAFAQKYFDAAHITVENQALGGMSSRTYYKQLWEPVRRALRPGDWVLVSIGHNDNGPYDSGRARASIPGTGHDSLIVTIKETGQKDTVYTYGGYMRKYIADIRRAGAHPVLMSLTPRDAYDEDGHAVRKPHSEWLRQIGEEQHVPYIDLNEISGQKLDGYSQWKRKYMFHGDHIHTSLLGAEMNLRSAVEGLARSTDPQLATLQQWLVGVALPTVPVQRQKGRPVVFITGDSTVKNADSDPDGMWGWGALAAAVFDTTRVTVVNCAMAGRSCRSYLREGRWERVYNSLQPGDYVLIQFGHNDFGELEKGKYRGEIYAAYDTTHVYKTDKGYELVYSFGWYLRKFIDDVREKGATPVLVSLTPRNEWKPAGKGSEGNAAGQQGALRIERRNDSYGAVYREVVRQTAVDFVDLHNLTADYLDAHCHSKEEAAPYYKRDHTHTSLLGARLNADNVAKGLRLAGSRLAQYLR